MRNRKKLLCICITLLVSAMLPASAFAQALGIIAPASSSTLDSGENVKIEFEVPSGDTATLLIDGNEVYESDSPGNNSITLPQPLALGKHSIELVAEGAGGTAYVSDCFTVMERGAETLLTANFNDGKVAPFSFQGAGQVGIDSDGTTPVTIDGIFCEGPDGGDDIAAGFLMKNSITTAITSPAPPAAQYLLNNNFKSDKWQDGINTIEYDIKFFSYCYFDIEGRSTSWPFFGGPAKGLATPNGKIGTVDYEPNKWMHLRHEIDYDNMRDRLYVDGVLAYDAELKAYAKGNYSLKFQFYRNGNEAGQGFAIDNIEIMHHPSIYGFSEMSYSSGESYVVASDNTVRTLTDKIKLFTNTPVITSESQDIDVNADYEGNELSVKTASVNAEGELEIIFENPLPTQGTVKLDISLPVRNGKNEVTSTKDYFYSFSCQCETVTISNVEITNPSQANKQYYLKKQLNSIKSEGAELSASVTIENPTGSSADVVLAAVVYDGNKLMEIKIDKLQVSDGNTVENTSFSVPAGIVSPQLEIYLFDSLTDNNALSKVWSLK